MPREPAFATGNEGVMRNHSRRRAISSRVLEPTRIPFLKLSVKLCVRCRLHNLLHNLIISIIIRTLRAVKYLRTKDTKPMFISRPLDIRIMPIPVTWKFTIFRVSSHIIGDRVTKFSETYRLYETVMVRRKDGWMHA
jgi:hypothetical protein